MPTDSSLTASPPPSFLLLFNYKPAYSVSITQPCSHWTFAVHPRTDGPATPGRPTAWRGATLKPRSTPASPWPYICMPHFFASAAAAQPAAPSVQSMTGKSMTKVLPTWSRSEVWGGRTLHTAQHTTGAAYRPLRPGCLPLPAAHSLLTPPHAAIDSCVFACAGLIGRQASDLRRYTVHTAGDMTGAAYRPLRPGCMPSHSASAQIV